jgi:hypothetical protein
MARYLVPVLDEYAKLLNEAVKEALRLARLLELETARAKQAEAQRDMLLAEAEAWRRFDDDGCTGSFGDTARRLQAMNEGPKDEDDSCPFLDREDE